MSDRVTVCNVCRQAYPVSPADANTWRRRFCSRACLLSRFPRFTHLFEQQVWNKVDRSGGDDACWIWTGATSRGKPKLGIYHHGKSTSMHAVPVIWTLIYGVPFAQPYIRKRWCDCPRCVNVLTHYRVPLSADHNAEVSASAL